MVSWVYLFAITRPGLSFAHIIPGLSFSELCSLSHLSHSDIRCFGYLSRQHVTLKNTSRTNNCEYLQVHIMGNENFRVEATVRHTYPRDLEAPQSMRHGADLTVYFTTRHARTVKIVLTHYLRPGKRMLSPTSWCY